MTDFCACGASWEHSDCAEKSDGNLRKDAVDPVVLDWTPKGLLPRDWDTRVTPLRNVPGSAYIAVDGGRPPRDG